MLCSVVRSAGLPPEWQEARASSDSCAARRPVGDIYFVCIVPRCPTRLLELKAPHLPCTQTYLRTVGLGVGSELVCEICWLGHGPVCVITARFGLVSRWFA